MHIPHGASCSDHPHTHWKKKQRGKEAVLVSCAVQLEQDLLRGTAAEQPLAPPTGV